MSTQGRFERTGFIITTVLNVVGFISLWKQRKKVCVAGTIQKLQSKIIALIFLRRIIYVNSFFKFVSVKHNGSLSSSLRWGYSFKFVKKACIILLHEIKLPIKPLASLKSLQPPYNHVAL